MYVSSVILRRQISERLALCLSRRNLSYGSARAITSKIFEKFHENQQQNQVRFLPIQTITGPFTYRHMHSGRKPPSSSDNKPSSASGDDDSSDDGEDYLWSDRDWSSGDDYSDGKTQKTDLALPNTVPDFFPRVPLIAMKYPIFPKFSKILEVSDPKLIQRLQWAVGSYAPYAGVFLLKDPESESTQVTNINQLHPIGTFVKIGEMERRGDQLHLIATGHRRIQLIRAVDEEPRRKTVLTIKDIMKPTGGKVKVADNNNKSIPSKTEISKVADDNNISISTKTENIDAKTPKNDVPKQIYMVETENVASSDIDKQSTEYKAVTLEIVSSIREIIAQNPFIQETVKQMLGENLNVADNPAYLADLAAAITSARPAELQQILEEKDVICDIIFDIPS